MPTPSTTRVLLLADTHGALDPRIAKIAHECDVVVHAGDVGNASVLATLSECGARLVAVCGNNDVASKWPASERAVVQALPAIARAELPGGILVATHGDRYAPSTRHARLRAAFPAARAIVYGHSHRLVVDDAEIPWVLNPGAAGRARTYGGPSCLVLEAATKSWRVEPRRFAPLSGR